MSSEETKNTEQEVVNNETECENNNCENCEHCEHQEPEQNQEVDLAAQQDGMRSLRDDLLGKVIRVAQKTNLNRRDTHHVLSDMTQLLILQEDSLRNLMSEFVVFVTHFGELTSKHQENTLLISALFNALVDENVVSKDKLKESVAKVFKEYTEKMVSKTKVETETKAEEQPLENKDNQ